MQLLDVGSPPLLNETPRGTRKLSSDSFTRGDLNKSFMFAVDRVKVRWTGVNEVHVDHDPVKLAQPRHRSNLAASLTGQPVIPFKEGRPDVP